MRVTLSATLYFFPLLLWFIAITFAIQWMVDSVPGTSFLPRPSLWVIHLQFYSNQRDSEWPQAKVDLVQSLFLTLFAFKVIWEGKVQQESLLLSLFLSHYLNWISKTLTCQIKGCMNSSLELLLEWQLSRRGKKNLAKATESRILQFKGKEWERETERERERERVSRVS